MSARSRINIAFCVFVALCCSCVPLGDDDSAWAGDAGGAGECNPAIQDCSVRCNAQSDCDPGYACLMIGGRPVPPVKTGSVPPAPDAAVTGKEPVPSTTGANSVREPPRADEDAGRSDDDAGQLPPPPPVSPLDAGQPSPPKMQPDASGSLAYCSLLCNTASCPDPHDVCSSPNGFCRPGCDAERPDCDAGTLCDSASMRCIDPIGRCKSNVDCGFFDARLADLGDKSCVDTWCRFSPNPLPAARAARNGLRQIGVDQPAPGMRIATDQLKQYVFDFDVPADVIVAAILTRPHRSIADATSAAVWAAYASAKEASHGLKLDDGGSIDGGRWMPASPQLDPDTTYYFLVLGYARGEAVAESDLIPFSIGERYKKAGESCTQPNNAFCPSATALICARGTCRTPCLSDSDCARENLSCSPPGRKGIDARICL